MHFKLTNKNYKIMDVKELRIGNLFNYKVVDNLDERKEWYEVSEIDAQDLLYLEKNPNDEDFQPIPITEEWLLKFGFDERLHGWWSNKIFLRKDEKGNLFFDWNGTTQTEAIELKFVHYLKNLYFALTGEELGVSDAVS